MDQGRTVRCLVATVGPDSDGGGRVLTRALRDAGFEEFDAFEDTLLVVGGSVPGSDREALYGAGVAEIFDSDDVEEAIAFVRENVPERR